jgi:hypothetical protein
MGKRKKGPNKQITLEHANRQKEDKKVFEKKWRLKVNETLEHKKHEQKGKVVIIGFMQPKAPR